MENKTIKLLLLLSVAGIGYLIWYQNFHVPSKMKKCNDIAVMFEKAQHYPIDDLQVTNQDISSYMKNFVNCFVN